MNKANTARRSIKPQTIAQHFLGQAETLTKTASLVRSYLLPHVGNDEALKAAQHEVYDCIRADAGTNEKGGLIAAAKLPVKHKRVYDAARTAFSRFIKDQNRRESGERVKLQPWERAATVADEWITKLQKSDDACPKLLAAWKALRETCKELGA